MKKLSTLLILVAAFFTMQAFTNAQSNLSIEVGDTLVRGSVDDDLGIHAVVKNNSTNTNIVTMLKVYMKEIVDGQSLLICWGDQCLPPIDQVGLTSFSEEVVIAPGTTSDNKFHCDIDQGGVEGTMVATFVFYDKNNVNDSAAFTTTVVIGTTGIEDETATSFSISPNPSVDFLNLNFTEDIKTVKLYDITGVLLNSVNVDAGTNNLNLNLAGYSSGIYFLNVLRRDGVIETKRFVINK